MEVSGLNSIDVASAHIPFSRTITWPYLTAKESES